MLSISALLEAARKVNFKDISSRIGAGFSSGRYNFWNLFSDTCSNKLKKAIRGPRSPFFALFYLKTIKFWIPYRSDFGYKKYQTVWFSFATQVLISVRGSLKTRHCISYNAMQFQNLDLYALHTLLICWISISKLMEFYLFYVSNFFS